MQKQTLALALCILAGCGDKVSVSNSKQLARIIPSNTDQISNLKTQSVSEARKRINEIIKYGEDFESSFGAYDKTRNKVMISLHLLQLLELLHPDKSLRFQGRDAALEIQTFIFKELDTNRELYNKLARLSLKFLQDPSLSTQQKYYIKQCMENFRANGMELAKNEYTKFKRLKSEISSLSAKYNQNIQENRKHILLKKEELDGLSQEFIAGLKQNSEGLYEVGTDYPTYFKVIKQATNAGTRTKIIQAFTDTAYPENYNILQKILQEREALAKILDHRNYAVSDLKYQMIKNPEKAQEFLDGLIEIVKNKAEKEVEKLKKTLPAGVETNPEGKISYQDLAYILYQHEVQNYKIDEERMSEFFEFNTVVANILKFYEDLFRIKFVEVESKSKLWSPEVKLIRVEKDSHLIGHIFLDLQHRQGKYHHARVLSIRTSEGVPGTGGYQPGAVVIIANSNSSEPALLTLRELTTIFHEFGHALHGIFINSKLSFMFSSQMAIRYGLPVKTDFVEVPSTTLQKWLFDALPSISQHYKTGEQLQAKEVKKIRDMQNMHKGIYTLRQIALSKLALELHSGGVNELSDIQSIYEKNMKISNITGMGANHFPASFHHLVNYGAKVYSYTWADVIASDIFAELKSKKDVERFVEVVLKPGGSVDPGKLVEGYLGREVDSQAFLREFE